MNEERLEELRQEYSENGISSDADVDEAFKIYRNNPQAALDLLDAACKDARALAEEIDIIRRKLLGYKLIFQPETILTPDFFDGSEEEAKYIVDNNVQFEFDEKDLVEVHFYHPSDVSIKNSRWPSASRYAYDDVVNVIKLESAFGWKPAEDFVLVRKVKVI